MSNPTSAYIHLPFCRRRCYYCDFAISVVGDNPLSSDSLMVKDYVEHLCQEIELGRTEQEPLKTVFFGGGTPSLLPVEDLAKILKTLDLCLEIAPEAEISIEIDPGTFDYPQLQEYLNLGINRFSLGVQSFEPELLAVCGRTHDLQDIFTAVELIDRANIKNYSLDLMTGLPQQTIEHCQNSLQQAIAISPAHLSCYDLVLEPVTAFGKQYRPGATPLPTEETTAQMYRLTQQLLSSAGYQHYEISNYARSGYQCQHNRVYWLNQAYYGFGMSAASYTKGIRFSRPRTRKTYYEWVKQGAKLETDGVKQPTTSRNDRLLETLMLGLRLTEGISLIAIAEEHGETTLKQLLRCLEPFQKQDLVSLHHEQIQLNDPEGLLVSNTILATLFEKLAVDE